MNNKSAPKPMPKHALSKSNTRTPQLWIYLNSGCWKELDRYTITPSEREFLIRLIERVDSTGFVSRENIMRDTYEEAYTPPVITEVFNASQIYGIVHRLRAKFLEKFGAEYISTVSWQGYSIQSMNDVLEARPVIRKGARFPTNEPYIPDLPPTVGDGMEPDDIPF